MENTKNLRTPRSLPGYRPPVEYSSGAGLFWTAVVIAGALTCVGCAFLAAL